MRRNRQARGDGAARSRSRRAARALRGLRDVWPRGRAPRGHRGARGARARCRRPRSLRVATRARARRAPAPRGGHHRSRVGRVRRRAAPRVGDVARAVPGALSEARLHRGARLAGAAACGCRCRSPITTSTSSRSSTEARTIGPPRSSRGRAASSCTSRTRRGSSRMRRGERGRGEAEPRASGARRCHPRTVVLGRESGSGSDGMCSGRGPCPTHDRWVGAESPWVGPRERGALDFVPSL